VHLVQILLPSYDNAGRHFPARLYRAVEATLAEKFGGVTFYSRTAAEGTWTDKSGSEHRDDIVVVEVMVEVLDRAWWAGLTQRVKSAFRQKQLVVRAMPIELLEDIRSP
jgi:hypothetical protein